MKTGLSAPIAVFKISGDFVKAPAENRTFLAGHRSFGTMG
jgi:hypothetical protein